MNQKQKMRVRLCGEQNHRCCYCGVRFDAANPATIEHVRPKAKGGKNRWANLVAACLRCNGLRGVMNAWRFFRKQGWHMRTNAERAAICPDYQPTARLCAPLGAVWPDQNRQGMAA